MNINDKHGCDVSNVVFDLQRATWIQMTFDLWSYEYQGRCWNIHFIVS